MSIMARGSSKRDFDSHSDLDAAPAGSSSLFVPPPGFVFQDSGHDAPAGALASPGSSAPAPTTDSIRMLMWFSNTNAGTIIGKGGKSISSIREESGCRVMIAEPAQAGAERLVTLLGAPLGINRAVQLMLERIEHQMREGGAGAAAAAGGMAGTAMAVGASSAASAMAMAGGSGSGAGAITHSLKLCLGNHQVGAVIGKGGAQIKALREESGATIRVETASNAMTSERLVTVAGGMPEVVRAHQLLALKLATVPEDDGRTTAPAGKYQRTNMASGLSPTLPRGGASYFGAPGANGAPALFGHPQQQGYFAPPPGSQHTSGAAAYYTQPAPPAYGAPPPSAPNGSSTSYSQPPPGGGAGTPYYTAGPPSPYGQQPGQQQQQQPASAQSIYGGASAYGGQPQPQPGYTTSTSVSAQGFAALPYAPPRYSAAGYSFTTPAGFGATASLAAGPTATRGGGAPMSGATAPMPTGGADNEVFQLVPSVLTGRLIGKGGSGIKELRDVSRATIRIQTECEPGTEQRKLTVSGTPEAVQMALAMIGQKLAQGP